MNNSLENSFLLSRRADEVLSRRADEVSYPTSSENENGVTAPPEVPRDEIPQELKCGICMELHCRPLFFPCGHSLCRLCHINVDSSTDSRTFTAPIFKCPMCRETTTKVWKCRPVNRALDNICKEKHPLHYNKLLDYQNEIIEKDQKKLDQERILEIPESSLSLNLSEIASEAREKLALRVYKELMILFSSAAMEGKTFLTVSEKNMVEKIEICLQPLCKKLFEKNNVYKVTCTPDECTVFFSKVSLRWDRDYINSNYETSTGDAPSSPPPPPNPTRRGRRATLFSGSLPMSEIRALVRDHMNR